MIKNLQFKLISTVLGACVALGHMPGSAQQAREPAQPSVFGADAAQADAVQQDIETLLDDYEKFRLAFYPREAARKDGRLTRMWRNVSPAYRAQEFAALEALYDRLLRLGTSHTLDTAILEVLLSSQIDNLRQDPDRLPFTGDSGFHTEPTFTISRARIRDEQDAEDLIAQIMGIPAYFEANVENMRRGISTGYVSHKDPLATTFNQIQEMIVTDHTQSPLFAPFAALPDDMSVSTKLQIRTKAGVAIDQASAAYADLLDFMQTEYAPQVREKPGIGSIAGGREAYRAAVKFHTTRPDLTPEKIHAIGQSEVQRIRAEMEEIIEEVGFDGSFSAFLDFLRTDPQFYAKTPEELLGHAAALSKTLDAALPQFFGKLPRLTYVVAPVPAEIAPGYTTGRYSRGDLLTGRPGTYLVNTYRLDQRPLYELPSLTAHEAVPGHHLQISLAKELEDVPEFRKNYYATAFGEGWGLYAERIAGEAGLYDTPYKRFGALSYEMWRACRLVADTGMHWLGWTREEGEACFRENSALSDLNIQTEVTRYIGWPGQALGYKIGEITIRELRAEAEAALGEAFDIRAFHDLILAEGAVPLSLLETRVRAWIAGQAETLESQSTKAP